MPDFIQFCLFLFRSCFPSLPSFHNFVACVSAFIASPNPDSLSSLVRALSLKPNCYDQLEKFLKKADFNLDEMVSCLIKLVIPHAPLWIVNGHIVAIGDGCKKPKDGRRIPGLSKEYSDSQSASKPKGHFKALNHGVLAFLGRHHGQFFTLPISAPIVAGNKEILEWQGLERNTQPAQMAIDALKVIGQVQRSILLVLDRFYLSKALLDPIFEYNQSHEEKLHVLARAKMNLQVWTFHQADSSQKRGRGRPKKRDFYSLSKAFEDFKDQFQKTTVSWNGRRVPVEILCLDDFFWGDLENPFPLRFVLVKSPMGNSIFATTDFTLTGKDAVETYALRFQIELSFKNQNELFGSYSGRFHCQALEKFKMKKGIPSPASRVKKKDRKKVIETYNAHERYTQISLIAYCICELCRVRDESDPSQRRIYQRTYGATQSLREMKSYLGDQIKTEIWSSTENWLNRILGRKITTVYHPKEIILRDRDRIRIVRR